MSYTYLDPKQAEYYFVELTKRATLNRQKRLSLKEDEVYIAFQDPQSIPPIGINIPTTTTANNQYVCVRFP